MDGNYKLVLFTDAASVTSNVASMVALLRDHLDQVVRHDTEKDIYCSIHLDKFL